MLESLWALVASVATEHAVSDGFRCDGTPEAIDLLNAALSGARIWEVGDGATTALARRGTALDPGRCGRAARYRRANPLGGTQDGVDAKKAEASLRISSGPPQLGHFLLQLADLSDLLAGLPGPHTAFDLGLTDPLAQRLRRGDAKLRRSTGSPRTRRVSRPWTLRPSGPPPHAACAGTSEGRAIRLHPSNE